MDIDSPIFDQNPMYSWCHVQQESLTKDSRGYVDPNQEPVLSKLSFNSFLFQPKTCWKWMLREMVCEKGYSIFGGQEILHDSQEK